MESLTIGVVGNGFVGRAMTMLRPNVNVKVWDIDPTKVEPQGMSFNDFVMDSGIIFIAVPTPMSENGECHLDIVESVVSRIRLVDNQKWIILRSTVPPGTSEKLGISFMPEFLTERNWKEDFINCEQWILGTEDDSLFDLTQKVFLASDVKNKKLFKCSINAAELIKYTKNVFLSVKVSYFNEIEDYCRQKGIDYEEVRSLVSADSRIGGGHTLVPGIDGKRGFGGTCFPKDCHALLCEMKRSGVNPFVIPATISRNELVDRPEMDWLIDKGRASL